MVGGGPLPDSASKKRGNSASSQSHKGSECEGSFGPSFSKLETEAQKGELS